MFQMLVSFEFPYISCQQDSVLSLDVIISENYYMALIGAPQESGGVLIIYMGFFVDFSDFFKSIHFDYSNYPEAKNYLNLTSFNIILTHNSDPLFGMDVDLIFINDTLIEVMTLGSRLYLFRIDSIFSALLKHSPNSNKRYVIELNDTFIEKSVSEINLSFFPNRFSFNEDWKSFYHGSQMNTIQSSNTLTVLFSSHAGNQEMFLNATRAVPQSTEGTEVSVVDSGIWPSETIISKKDPFDSFFINTEQKCPPGSYNPSNGFSAFRVRGF